MGNNAGPTVYHGDAINTIISDSLFFAALRRCLNCGSAVTRAVLPKRTPTYGYAPGLTPVTTTKSKIGCLLFFDGFELVP